MIGGGFVLSGLEDKDSTVKSLDGAPPGPRVVAQICSWSVG